MTQPPNSSSNAARIVAAPSPWFVNQLGGVAWACTQAWSKVFRRQYMQPGGLSWRMDETYVKVNGVWKYRYPAVEKEVTQRVFESRWVGTGF